MKNNYLVQAWLVLALSLFFGAGLAAVETTLSPKIKANKLADTMGQIPNLVPGAATGEQDLMGEQVVYRAMDADGKQVGWVVAASGQGFADKIELLIGVDMSLAKITGLYVLDQKETPGLGNKIVDAKWRDQFQGKPMDQSLVVVKTTPDAANQIEGVTGATISSDSVVSIVNTAIVTFKEELAKQGKS